MVPPQGLGFRFPAEEAHPRIVSDKYAYRSLQNKQYRGDKTETTMPGREVWCYEDPVNTIREYYSYGGTAQAYQNAKLYWQS